MSNNTEDGVSKNWLPFEIIIIPDLTKGKPLTFSKDLHWKKSEPLNTNVYVEDNRNIQIMDTNTYLTKRVKKSRISPNLLHRFLKQSLPGGNQNINTNAHVTKNRKESQNSPNLLHRFLKQSLPGVNLKVNYVHMRPNKQKKEEIYNSVIFPMHVVKRKALMPLLLHDIRVSEKPVKHDRTIDTSTKSTAATEEVLYNETSEEFITIITTDANSNNYNDCIYVSNPSSDMVYLNCSIDIVIATTTSYTDSDESSKDDCYNFVSCVHPYVSYLAGIIMFTLVLYLIIVFGRCVCDDTY